MIRHPNNSDAIREALVNSVKRLGLRLNYEELSTAFYALKSAFKGDSASAAKYKQIELDFLAKIKEGGFTNNR